MAHEDNNEMFLTFPEEQTFTNFEIDGTLNVH